MWEIKKIISKGDYNYAFVPEHPHCTKNGFVLEHRIVVENHLNRLLNENEVVHHKNGSTKDNRIGNLKVMLDSLHRRHHAKLQGKKLVILRCPNCGDLFKRRKGQTFLQKGSKYTCCSRKCRGIFNRKIQLYGITSEVEQAISENVVKEYRSFDNSEQTEDDGMRRGHTPAA